MNAKCMNAVRDPNRPGDWIRCGWEGQIIDINSHPCPRCYYWVAGQLAHWCKSATLIQRGPADPQ